MLDGAAMPVPHCSTEQARPRHRRENDFHTPVAVDVPPIFGKRATVTCAPALEAIKPLPSAADDVRHCRVRTLTIAVKGTRSLYVVVFAAKRHEATEDGEVTYFSERVQLACKTLEMLPVLGALASRYHRLRDAFEQFIGNRDIACGDPRSRVSARLSPLFEFDL